MNSISEVYKETGEKGGVSAVLKKKTLLKIYFQEKMSSSLYL